MKKAILNNLHEQFAINQHEHDNRFITFFIAILTLLGSYGLIYAMNLEWVENKFKVTPYAVLSTSLIVGIVLAYFICLTLVASKIFRRDQLMNDRIRFFSMFEEEYNAIFINYNGENKNWLDFIPDFLKIRLYFLFVIKFIVIISVVSYFFYNEFSFLHYAVTLTLIIIILLLVFLIIFWCQCFNKYKDLYIKSNKMKVEKKTALFPNIDIKREMNSNNENKENDNSSLDQYINFGGNHSESSTSIKQSINLNFKK